MNSASAKKRSVLRTPVGPRNTNEPIGRFGSCKPVRARDGIGCVELSYDPTMETLLHVDFFFQAEDGIRDGHVTGVQTCALPISPTSTTSWQAPASCCGARSAST